MPQEHQHFEHARSFEADAALLHARRRDHAVAVGAELAIDEVLFSEQQERMNKMVENFRAQRIADGLGYGDGGISKDVRIEDPKDPLDKDIIAKVEAAITSPRILVPVEADDDGCGDGRGVGVIRRGAEILKRSLHRAKVFGGGLMMAVAARIGDGEPAGSSLKDSFAASREDAKKYELNYGAHTGSHAHGPNCGCGAIDQAPQIIENALKFKREITGAIGLLDPDHDSDVLENIFENYKSYSETAGNEYQGSEIIEQILDEEKVVKELVDEHLENHVVINTIADMTVDQGYVREVSDGKAQVFAVDAWRLLEIAAKLHPGDEKAQQKAYLSMLVYTLATAGTLTRGDLPVYVLAA